MITRSPKKETCNSIWSLVATAAAKNYISIDIILAECGRTWKQFAVDFTKKEVSPALKKKYINGIASAVEKSAKRKAVMYARYGINGAQGKKLNSVIKSLIGLAVDLGAWDVPEE